MKKALIFIVCIMFCHVVLASGIDDKEVCLYYTNQTEQYKKIKPNILSTITLVETGRNSKENIVGYPWPWTIAYQGKGEYFETKQQAIDKVKKLKKKGINSIDVGCMQINLFYHSKAFESLEHAFDPKTNVEYAGDFINRLYKKHGTWGAAATAYHSHNPDKAHKYEDKLIKVWARLERYLANGGTLYNEPQTQLLANAFKSDISETSPEIELNTSTPILVSVDSEKKDVLNVGTSPAKPETINDVYDLSSADFAKQWRARKLTEYRLKKAEEVNPVYRSNAVRVGGS